MKLKQITFYFENCDWITIDGKYVGDFLVDELHTYFKRTACNAIEKVDAADVFAIEIHKDANKERYQFEQNQYDDFKQMTFDRFSKSRDISSIGFELEVPIDEETCKLESYDYYLNWTGDSDYENEAQTNYVSKDGHLYIVVAKDKGIEDFFNKEEIDDSEYIDFHFDMCDVGDKYGDPDRYKNEAESVIDKAIQSLDNENKKYFEKRVENMYSNKDLQKDFVDAIKRNADNFKNWMQASAEVLDDICSVANSVNALNKADTVFTQKEDEIIKTVTTFEVDFKKESIDVSQWDENIKPIKAIISVVFTANVNGFGLHMEIGNMCMLMEDGSFRMKE